MCIIIVRPAGAKMPPKAIIERCARLNPHGFGFATKDRIYKTLNFSEFCREIKTISKEETAILHFRYATHGSIKLENCHPFKDEISGVSFAHNGILNIVPYEDMTDSETAFRGILVPVIRRHGFGSDRFINSAFDIVGGSRFAFINSDGEYRLFGQFTQHGGCWYSNRNFLPITEHRYSYAR